MFLLCLLDVVVWVIYDHIFLWAKLSVWIISPMIYHGLNSYDAPTPGTKRREMWCILGNVVWPESPDYRGE